MPCLGVSPVPAKVVTNTTNLRHARSEERIGHDFTNSSCSTASAGNDSNDDSEDGSDDDEHL